MADETEKQKQEREQQEQMELVFRVAAGIWLVGLTITAIDQGNRISELEEAEEKATA